MEHFQNTTKLYGIKDKNIEILSADKHQTHIEIQAKLDYAAPTCPHYQGNMIKYYYTTK
jgi:transposase